MLIRSTLNAMAAFGLAAVLAAPAAAQEEGLHAFLAAGLTLGGDTLATTVFTNGDTQKINAGELVQLGGGVQWTPDAGGPSYAFGLHYHGDTTTATNGEVEFTRYPLEALAYLPIGDGWRIGGGLRYALSPKFESNIDFVGSSTVRFKDALGVVLEAGFLVTESFRINLRYVNEEYEPESRTVNGVAQSVAGLPTVDGSHIGINASFTF